MPFKDTHTDVPFTECAGGNTKSWSSCGCMALPVVNTGNKKKNTTSWGMAWPTNKPFASATWDEAYTGSIGSMAYLQVSAKGYPY